MSEREARVTQPTTDRYREATAELHRRYLAARTSEEKESIWRDILAVDKAIDPPKIKRSRADRPPEPPTLDVERLARVMHEAGICENWSPGYGRLDANGDFHDDHGAAEHFHEARRVAAALGASPPPPDLSESPLGWEEHRKAHGWPTPNSMRSAAEALDRLVIPKYGDILRWVADACDAALASQPPSTPREP